MAGNGLDARFRQLTPLLLLGVLLLLVFEPWLPLAWLRSHLGADVVVRAAAVVLAFYVLLLWSETQRLGSVLTGVLQAFREFGGKGVAAPKNPKTRLEAARVLIAALGSDDPSIRETSRHNLTKLAGKDLGSDPAAWHRWLREQEGGPAQG